MAASPASVRLAPLKHVRKIENARPLDSATYSPLLRLAPCTEVSLAARRRLPVNWKKVGRFMVKCLADLATDSAMAGSWP